MSPPPTEARAAPLIQALTLALRRHHPPQAPLGLACSGGRDSMALLHALLALQTQGVGLFQGVQVLHVNHGLSPHASQWADQVAWECEQARRRGAVIAFQGMSLAGGPAAGESVEAWARSGRYRLLAQGAREHGLPTVCLAHHQQDQAETWLLQGLRGAGTPGLSAMPVQRSQGGVTWLRPWLSVARAALDPRVFCPEATWVDDPSNADPRWARNRLRHRVLPILEAAFPGALRSLQQSAQHVADTQAALDEYVWADVWAVAGDAPLPLGAGLATGRPLSAEPAQGGTEGAFDLDPAPPEHLDLSRWLALSRPRRAEVLRLWCRRRLGRSPSSAVLQQCLTHWHTPTVHGVWPVGCARLWVYQGRIGGSPNPTEPTPHPPPLHSADWPGFRDLQWRPRQGGERFAWAPGRPSRPLRKQFQDRGIPPWERPTWLLWSGDRLLYVPQLGLNAWAQAD